MTGNQTRQPPEVSKIVYIVFPYLPFGLRLKITFNHALIFHTTEILSPRPGSVRNLIATHNHVGTDNMTMFIYQHINSLFT